ncbi:MAG: c-type cytochrome [Lacipirellulaceae bacterium]
MRWFSLLGLLVTTSLLFSSGCRRVEPPRFSPGPEVVELTEEIDDEEELAEYKKLQDDIAVILAQRTGTPDKPIMLGSDQTTDELQHGYALYARYCTQCHGVNGDGNGPVAVSLNPKPRNYRQGIFKFTSTPYGSKPRFSDLAYTIKRGVIGTSMPSFDRFSEEQVNAVVSYVVALTHRGELERELAMIAYDDGELPDEEGVDDVVAEILDPWQEASTQLVMPVTPMPPMTEESIKAGHEIFLGKACNKCHGKYGRGGSMGNVEVGTDAWGFKAAAADLSSGMFHGGGRPIDLYRRIYSGINGSPMPAFANTFEEDPDQIWQLVHFIKATGNRRREGLPPLGEADIPDTVSAEQSSAEEQPEELSDEAEEADGEDEESEDDGDDTQTEAAEPSEEPEDEAEPSTKEAA